MCAGGCGGSVPGSSTVPETPTEDDVHLAALAPSPAAAA